MSIVDGTGLIEWEGGLFDPAGDLLPRVRWAFTAIRDAGGDISLNEAGRPFGVFSDQYARNSSDTESGRSTVWFQWGRFERGETPSAANPAGGPFASEHTQGIAIDCNAAQPGLRARFFAMVGLENTIASESWHWAIRAPSTVDLSGFASLNVTPISNPIIGGKRKMWIYWVTVDNVPTFGRLTNGLQSVQIETPDDERILRQLINSDQTSQDRTKETAAFTGNENERINYYLDSLAVPRQGQQARAVQLNG